MQLGFSSLQDSMLLELGSLPAIAKNVPSTFI